MSISISGDGSITGVSTSYTFDKSVSIAGTVSYEDVTSIDAVGIITAQSGIHIDDSIVHLGDTNTKIRFPAADTVTVETSGSERLRIDSSGLIGVGNINPANYNSATNNLVISESGGDSGITLNTGSSNASYLAFNDTGNSSNSGWVGYMHSANSTVFGTGGAERVRIDSSGRVLLGATSTDYSNIKLLVAGTAGTNYISMLNTTATDSDEARFSYLHFRGTQSGGEVSSLVSIGAQHDGSSDDQKGELTFRTNDGSDGNSPTERMRISSTGKCQVYKGTSTTGKTSGSEAFTVGNGGGNHRFAVYPDGTTVIGGTGDIGNNNILLQNDGKAIFGGTVGINKSSPSSDAQLDVVGSSYWPILVKTNSTGGGGVAIKDKDDVTSLYTGTGGSAWLTG